MGTGFGGRVLMRSWGWQDIPGLPHCCAHHGGWLHALFIVHVCVIVAIGCFGVQGDKVKAAFAANRALIQQAAACKKPTDAKVKGVRDACQQCWNPLTLPSRTPPCLVVVVPSAPASLLDSR